jgi:Na+-driven multidrug efflux pump
MLPICWWLALHTDYGVWGVIIGISIASILAGLGQVIALEWKSARGVKFGLKRAGVAAPAVH